MLLPVFCKDWSIPAVTAVYVAKGKVPPVLAYKIKLLDTTPVKGDLAYHDIISDIPYGNVYAKTVLSYNGVILYEPTLKRPTVAQTLCHEVFELLVDPRCTMWWMNINTGVLYAGEVADPVESNAVVVNVGPVKVTMSDWILPAWQDVQSKSGPYNHLNTLRTPFAVDKNGYVIYIKNGLANYVFGSNTTPEMKARYQRKGRIPARASTVKPNS